MLGLSWRWGIEDVTYLYTQTHTDTHTHTHTHVHTYVYIYVCKHVCICIRTQGAGTRGPRCQADGTFELGRICAPNDVSRMVGVAVGLVLANVSLAAAMVYTTIPKLG
jgi:hypothetical protein